MRIPRMKTVVAMAALSSLAILTPSLVVGFSGEPAEKRPQPIRILASPSILHFPMRCRIEVDEQPPTAFRTVVKTYEGTVVDADDEGVRLDVREVRVVETTAPAVAKVPFYKVPFFDRMFRNVGIGRPAPDPKRPAVAIAAAKIRSVTVLPEIITKAEQTGRLEFAPPSLP